MTPMIHAFRVLWCAMTSVSVCMGRVIRALFHVRLCARQTTVSGAEAGASANLKEAGQCTGSYRSIIGYLPDDFARV